MPACCNSVYYHKKAPPGEQHVSPPHVCSFFPWYKCRNHTAQYLSNTSPFHENQSSTVKSQNIHISDIVNCKHSCRNWNATCHAKSQCFRVGPLKKEICSALLSQTNLNTSYDIYSEDLKHTELHEQT
jgi:hypothetical protein